MPTVSVKLTPEEKLQLRQNAKAKHMSISDYLRYAITAMKSKQRKQQWKVTGRPGRVLIVPPPGTPPITDADMEAEDEEYYQQ